jgi:PAS domain S-box-containing protein
MEASSIKVLLIDDEPDLLDISKQFLELDRSISVDSSLSAAEALKLIGRREYDVIVSDYQMPINDGIQLLKEIRGTGNKIPFILFTGKGREEVAIEALNNGADFYLQKGGQSASQFAELANMIKQAYTREQRELALRISEERYRSLFENSIDAVLLTSKDFESVLSANPSACKMFGMTEDEIRTTGIKGLITDDQMWENILQRLNQTGIAKGEFTYRRKDGTTFIGETTHGILTGQYGIARISMIVRDVTEQRNAEAALIASKDLLHEVEKAGKIGGWIFDVETLTQTWTEETFRILEIDLENGEPKVPQGVEFIDPAFRPMAEQAIQRAIEFGEPYEQEWEVITAKGNKRWVHVVATVQQEQGRTKSVSGSFQDITERKRNEEALRESEERYRTLVEASPDGIGLITLEGKVKWVNNRVAEMFEYANPSQMVGIGIFEMFAAEENELAQAAFEEYLRTGFQSELEFTMLRRDGTTFLGTIKGSILKDGNGDPYAIMGILRDITERKRAERAVIESEQRYRQLMEKANDAILIHEISTEGPGLLIEINDSACRMLGYEKDELLRMAITDIDVPEQKQNIRRIMQELQSSKSAFFKTELLAKGGARIPVEVSASLTDFNGKELIMAIVRDTSEIERAEKTLRELEGKFHNAFDWANDIILLHTLTVEGKPGRFIEANRVAINMLGYSREELFAMGPPDIVPTELHPQLAYILRQAQTKDNFLFETKLLRKDGTTIPVESNGHLVDYEGKRIWVSHIRDISERKKLEESIRDSERRYHTLYNNAQVGLFETDLEQAKILVCNQVYSDLAGFASVEEAIGSDLLHLYANPEDREAVKRILRTQGQTKNHILRLRNHTTGKEFWAEFSAEFDPKRDIAIGVIVDITERKLAEEALQNTQAQLRVAMDLAKLVHWEYDVDKDLFTFDDQFYALYGSNEEKEGGQLMSSATYANRFIPPEEAGIVAEETARAISTTDPNYVGNVTHTIIKSDGERRIINVRFGVVKDASGRTVRTFGANQDVTELKRLEDMMLNDQVRFEQLTEHGGIVAWEVDADGLYTYASQVSESVWGYLPDEVVGKKYFYDLTPETERQSLKTMAFQAFNAKERFIGLENTIRKKDGHIIIVSTNGIPILNADGTLRGYRGTDMDITDRKLAEEALRLSERKYRLLANNINDVIWTVNIATQKFTYVSPSVEKLSGFTAEENMQQELKDILHPDSYAEIVDQLPTWIDQFLHGSEAGKARRLYARQRRKDGTWMNIEVVATLLKDDNGEFTDILGVSRDVTQKVRNEKALLEANRKLNLLSRITRHDIKNQLMALDGNLTLLSMKELDPASEELLRKSNSALNRISAMIQFTKEYEDVGVKAPVWHNVRALIEKETKSVALEPIKLVNDIPSYLEVYADPLITKVFHNLIDNAVRHGSKVTTIHFFVEEHDHSHTIICEDDGVGIPSDVKGELFTHGSRKKHGLGLFLSREILAITGISIKENGKPGKGARFEITAPAEGLKIAK